MGQLVPVFASYLLLCFGIQYFREPREVGPGPLVSSYIFMFAAFLLLWDIRIYPRSLRKLGLGSHCVVEFFIASFLLENIMVDFWFPLELVVLNSAPKLADLLDEMLQSGNWSCDVICDALRNESTSFVASYVLSVFFLLAILHATRAIDLRELENGPVPFVRDILYRSKRYCKRQKRHLGIGTKKRVLIREKNQAPASSKPYKGHHNKNSNVNKPKKTKGPCDSELKYSFSDFELALKDDLE